MHIARDPSLNLCCFFMLIASECVFSLNEIYTFLEIGLRYIVLYLFPPEMALSFRSIAQAYP